MSGNVRFESWQYEYMSKACAEGVPNAEIAKRVELTVEQVKSYRKRLKQKEVQRRKSLGLPADPELLTSSDDHLCWSCFRATNPKQLLNGCPWSGLTPDKRCRFALPDGALRNQHGYIVSCPLFVSDEDGKREYRGALIERAEEALSLYGSAFNLF